MRNNDAHHPKESRTEVSPSFPAVWLGAMGAEGGGPIRIGKHPPEPVAPGKERKGLLEAVKKFRNEQKHLAQRRRGAESTKKIKQLLISNLCASASLREIVNFFTRSWHRFHAGSVQAMDDFECKRNLVTGGTLHRFILSMLGQPANPCPFTFSRIQAHLEHF